MPGCGPGAGGAGGAGGGGGGGRGGLGGARHALLAERAADLVDDPSAQPAVALGGEVHAGAARVEADAGGLGLGAAHEVRDAGQLQEAGDVALGRDDADVHRVRVVVV